MRSFVGTPSRLPRAGRTGPPGNPCSAWTLPEVLVAVGIIGILGVLLLPAISGIVRKQDGLICLSNLRQIGLGIQSYALDHEGDLPGPLYTAQYPYLNDSSQLSFYLVDYLKLDASKTKYRHNDVFVCPAYRRSMKQIGNGPVYTLNIHVPMEGANTPQQPFGYPNKQYPAMFGAPKDFPVMKLARLGQIVDSNGLGAASRTWMLKDIDQEDRRLQELSLGASSSFPKRRVHGDYRNAIFFDFHVEPVDREVEN